MAQKAETTLKLHEFRLDNHDKSHNNHEIALRTLTEKYSTLDKFKTFVYSYLAALSSIVILTVGVGKLSTIIGG